MRQKIKLLLYAIRTAKRVYIVGNGGSAANAIHIANDLFSCGIKAQALTADVATLTAIANDYGYNYIFARQLYVFGEDGDLLIALSGSGRSQNIIEAIITAQAKGMKVFSITGMLNDYDLVADIADAGVRHGKNMQEAEDYQVQLIHSVYRILKGLDLE